ncbi:MAG: sensor domain-containing diguanylate cyclase [Acidobacteriota bacterium]|nr:sensor domain-containing diguanylate cyclase [Acidobacteriota bacterium]
MRERRQFEVIESRQLDHLRVFHDVARALTQKLELEEILRTIMEKMAGFFGPQQWALMMMDEDGENLHYAIAVGETQETLKDLPPVKVGQGFAGRVAAQGTSMIVPDVGRDPAYAAFARQHPELRIQSIACLPISSKGKVLGVMQLMNSKLDLMSEYSLSFLRILCDYAAIAIENAQTMKLIQELTITDDVTGLYNARHLYTMLDEQIALGAGGRAYEFSLLFVDLDRFKLVNDTHGHRIGSLLLSEVGGLMKRSLGPENACFRYGGDEFVAILAGMDKRTAIGATMDVWQRLREQTFLTGERLDILLKGSFGLATFPEDGATMKEIIVAADTMMYSAKTTRDNICVAGLGLVAGERAEGRVPKRRSSTMAAGDLESRTM